MVDEEKERVQRIFTKYLFLPSMENDHHHAPVVVLHNNEANIYSRIKQFVHQKYLLPGDKFWMAVRHDVSPPRPTWRPRMNGTQTKSLQNARYPNTSEEWRALEDVIVGNMTDYMADGQSPVKFFRSLQVAIVELEHKWNNQRKQGHSGKKRVIGNSNSDGKSPSKSSRYNTNTMIIPDFGQDAPNPSVQGDNAMGARMGVNQHHNGGDGEMDPAGGNAGAENNAVNKASSKILVTLNVGGTEFFSTAATLDVVPGSFFSRLVRSSSGGQEFFIDRSPKVFHHILEYLRAKRYGEEIVERLPEDIANLSSLLREATFYGLPEYVLSVSKKIEAVASPKVEYIVSEASDNSIDAAMKKAAAKCHNQVSLFAF